MTQTDRPDPSPFFRPGIILSFFLLSLILYTFAFPNALFPKGWGALAWIALAPLFAVIPELRPKTAFGAGAGFGILLYALSNYWLWTYHPMALAIACLYAAAGLAPLFFLMSRVVRTFPARGFLAYPILWLAYEFLRSRGFMGYPYGVLGYAFWRNGNMLGLAPLGGVWLLSLAALFANAFFGQALRAVFEPNKPAGRFRTATARAVAALGIALASSIAGSLVPKGYEPRAFFKAALIQPGYTERQRSIQDYRAMAERLIRLTEEARREAPDLIVWHETAIVPPLAWHLRVRPDRDTLDFALNMDEYIRGLDIPLLFGNGRAEPAGNDPRRRRNWNSAFLFADGVEQARYDKMRLVPYSETFPPAELLPRIAAAIETEVGQFWESGTEFTIFRLKDAAFASPICFEDSFGDHMRSLAYAGADFMIVLTDDSWGRAASCQYHHLTQSVLRAAELGVPIARASNTGATVLIGPDGSILEELPPFAEGILYARIPLPPAGRKPTLYRAAGDVLGWASLGASFFLMLFVFFTRIVRNIRGSGKLDG